MLEPLLLFHKFFSKAGGSQRGITLPSLKVVYESWSCGGGRTRAFETFTAPEDSFYGAATRRRVFNFQNIHASLAADGCGWAEEQFVHLLRPTPSHSDSNCAESSSSRGMMMSDSKARAFLPPADATAIDSEHLPHSRSVGGEVNGEEGVEGREQPPM